MICVQPNGCGVLKGFEVFDIFWFKYTGSPGIHDTLLFFTGFLNRFPSQKFENFFVCIPQDRVGLIFSKPPQCFVGERTINKGVSAVDDEVYSMVFKVFDGGHERRVVCVNVREKKYIHDQSNGPISRAMFSRNLVMRDLSESEVTSSARDCCS